MSSRILIVADASESAYSDWQKTTETITWLLDQLESKTIMGIALLGTTILWSRRDWQPGLHIPLRGQHSFSVLAPVFQQLSRRKQPYPDFVIVVGDGQIFDLAEWQDSVSKWLLVHTDEESLQAEGQSLPEVQADEHQLAALLEELLFAEERRAHPPTPNLQGFVHHEWDIDAFGFPMIYVPPLHGYLSLFPLSNVQMEAMLAAKRHPQYNDKWYRELLTIFPRAAIHSISHQPYEKLFVTGLLPSEVLDFATWLGWPDTTVPDCTTWRTAYTWLADQALSVLPAELNQRLHPLARQLWSALWRHLQPQTMLQLSLMKNGVIEWTHEGADIWTGLGKTRPAFYPSFFDPLHSNPMRPVSLTQRSRLFGVRFFRRLS